MDTAEKTRNQWWQDSAARRVADYVTRRGAAPSAVATLTPDASLREYFRIPWETGATAIVAAYTEPFEPATQPFLDVTGLFQAARLPVPQVYDVVPEQGLIIQEDCGTKTLAGARQSLQETQYAAYLEQAIALLGPLQAATEMAAQRHSCAAVLAFDEAKLHWELTFFYEHFFGSLRKEQLSHSTAENLKAELAEIASDLSARPRVLCHRDYHADNLLIDQAGRLRLIDYQDARLGPVTYDLVSLLLDRVTSPPPLASLRRGRLALIEARRQAGLRGLEMGPLTEEFHLTTVQRVLKAVGTFSYQTAVRGRGALYAGYIPHMLRVALDAARWLGRFPHLSSILELRSKDAYL